CSGDKDTKKSTTKDKSSDGGWSRSADRPGSEPGGWGSTPPPKFSPPKDALKDKDAGESREAKREEPRVGGVDSVPGGRKGPKSGTLTAGSFDDNVDPRPYRNFLDLVAQDPAVNGLPAQFLGERLVLTVQDGAGRPVGNARVRLAPAGG